MHYRGINIALHSQLDIEALPEHYPVLGDGDTAISMPELFDSKTSTCNVFVPAVPGSAFWIKYLVFPPVPDEHHFLFKLYIDGAHVVNWSTGKAEGWTGKTMFGLFESPENAKGKKVVEKRMFCFVPSNGAKKHWEGVADVFDETACIEIRVHRADARKRIPRQIEEYGTTQIAQESMGINLVSAGRAGPEQPKRFYRFALIDPNDQPFARFRYFYRTRNQLRGLGLLLPDHNSIEEENHLPVIEPPAPPDSSMCNTDTKKKSHNPINSELHNSLKKDKNDIESKKSNTVSKRKQLTAVSRPTGRITAKARRPPYIRVSTRQPRGYNSHNANKATVEMPGVQRNEQASQQDSLVPKPARSYRLSVPPSIELEPTEPALRPLPVPPHKNSPQSSPTYCPHPGYLDGWTLRTPSPVQATEEEMTTSPSEKHAARGRKVSALVGFISSIWKRSPTNPR